MFLVFLLFVLNKVPCYLFVPCFCSDYDMLQIFGGIVNAGNLKLDGTDLSEDEYPLVFVEIFAFVLFFCCQ